MPERNLLVGAAVAAASGAIFASRRALRKLDAADQKRPGFEYRFPGGEINRVTTSDGGSIAVEITGDGPVVVLVHGITSSRDDWGPVARLLVEKGCTVVGVDQRGHGDSTVGDEGFGAARLGQDLEEVLRGLDLSGVTLVGHSMGGMAAMSYAVDYAESFAERVDGLVLVATIARTSRAYHRFGLRLLDDLLPLASNDMAVARPLSANALFGKYGSTKLVAAAKAAALRADREAIAACAIALGSFDISSRLGNIELPARLIYGSRDIVTPVFENRRIANGIDRAVSREIPGAGHLLIWTHHREICEEILLA